MSVIAPKAPRFSSFSKAAKALKNNKQMTCIRITDPSLNYRKEDRLSPSDKRMKGLNELVHFSSSLVLHGQQVEKLDISGTQLGMIGANVFVQLLRSNPRLKKLVLVGCRLGSKEDFEKAEINPFGFQVLEEALYAHQGIKQVKGLDDDSNGFTDEEQIRVTHYLTHLENKAVESPL